MDTPILEKLYDLIVAQPTYPGGVCPNDLHLTRYAAGALSAAEEPRLHRHLVECDECRLLAERLRTAAAWFADSRHQVFAGLLDKAAEVGLAPWTVCPDRGVLDRYIGGEIPETPAGAVFRRTMANHLDECRTCRQRAEDCQASLARTLVIKVEELGSHIAATVAECVRQMLGELQVVAVARGASGPARAMPGYRSSSTVSVAALLLDPSGRILLDDQGLPKHIHFSVLQATLELDGHFVLDLTTDEPSVWESSDRTYLIGVALCHENRKLVFPPERIDSHGRVTVIGTLTAGIEMHSIPLSALELTVIAAAESKPPLP